MNIHFFQHVPYEGLGCIESWAGKAGNTVTATRFFEDHRFPFIDLFDVLIVLGGPMGAYDEGKYSWMKQEKKMIEKAISKNKVVIGICLGSQLIAEVLGAKVYKNTHKEIGWFPVEFTQESEMVFPGLIPKSLMAFHWHGDTFDLPKGATNLCQSTACKQQAFSYGSNVLGLQFHPEITPLLLSQFLHNNSEELMQGKYIQDEREMRAASEENFEKSNALLYGMLDTICLANQLVV